jgi:hypothetical protein
VLLATATVGLCAIVTGIALAAFSSPGGQQIGHVANAGDGSSPASPVQPVHTTPGVASGKTGSRVTGAGTAKTALRYPPALRGQVLHWASGPGGAAWSAVTAELGGVTQSAGARLYAELRLECANLGSSVRTAQGAPPIPDHAMQRGYAKALAALSVTVADCRSAVSVRPEGDEGQQIHLDRALMKRTAAQFVAESKDLYTTTAEIRTLRG